MIFQAAELQNIGDKNREPLRRGGNPLCIQLPLCLSQIVFLQDRGIILDDGERCFQLVRHIGYKITFQDLRTGQFRGHGVKILIQHFELIFFAVMAVRWDPYGKIALRHPAGRIAEPPDRPHDIVPANQYHHRHHQNREDHEIRQNGQDYKNIVNVLPRSVLSPVNQDAGAARKENHQKNCTIVAKSKNFCVDAGIPGPFARCFHDSTALYPIPRTVTILNEVQFASLVRRFAINTSTVRRPLSLSTPENSSSSWLRVKIRLG